MAKSPALRILIAGGGTGGHLFPGLAIAEAFAQARPGCDVRFVGSYYGIEGRVVPERGHRLYRLPVRGLYGVSWLRRLRVAALLPVALLQSLWIILAFRPHLVLGVGGYASGPLLLAALLLRRRTAIQEQNAYPGMTNRLLGRHVQRAFVPVAGLEGLFPTAMVVGNPVRRAILALRERDMPPRTEPLVLVVGGSQGAHRINEAMADAAPLLHAEAPQLRIVHQTGAADRDAVAAAYAAAGLPAEVPAFIDDMPAILARARLVVSRAGASAVNELIAARCPAILIPIPGASGDHQRKNAQWMQAGGAAVLLEQTALDGERLARAILELMADPARLAAMEAATDALFPGDAAARIVEECLRMIG